VVKVIQFLILGLLIIHISESNASVADSSKSSWKKFISPNITLSQFVDVAIESEEYEDQSFNKIKLVKLFNSVDKDGDLEIDNYELLTMK
jgi:Ca2+-binding EF-hand superfamily protein